MPVPIAGEALAGIVHLLALHEFAEPRVAGLHLGTRGPAVIGEEVAAAARLGVSHQREDGDRAGAFIETGLTVLAELQRQGLVRHVGLSNVTPAQIAAGRPARA